MATFNGEKYILEQLESLKLQTHQPYELIVSDDDSSDDTMRIVKSFASTSKFPISIHKNENNLGFADNFIKSASLCKGDWIAFCDQDDFWLPNKLERIADEIKNNNKLLAIAHTSKITDHQLNDTGKFCPHFKRDCTLDPLSLAPWTIIEGFSLVVSKKILNIFPSSQRPFDHAAPPGKLLGHDQWFLLLASSFGAVRLISEPLACYRQHSGNFTGARKIGGIKYQAIKSRQVNKNHYESLAEISAQRTGIFKSLQHTLESSEWKHLAGQAADRYKQLHLWLSIRCQIHSNNFTTYHSILKLAKLCTDFAYRRPSRGGLGMKAFAKDLLHIISNDK